jgi:hypothetical protein
MTMTRASIRLLVPLLLLGGSVSFAQVRFTAGVKSWYATWNIPIPAEPGVEQASYGPAFMMGPYANLRYRQFSITAMYSTSLAHFTTDARNPGVFILGFNGNRVVSRSDINVFLNYSISPEVTLFANVKRLDYTQNEAISYITGLRGRTNQKFNGTGYGLGAQVTVPFTGNSPLYSFVSVGAVANSYESKEATVTFEGLGTYTVPQEFTGDEILYFIDAGVGMRFTPGGFGAALGIRAENAKDTRAIFGPTFNLFYTF